MARSSYIYLVAFGEDRQHIILAAFTVKYESQEWVEKSVYGFEDVELTRMSDGGDSAIMGTREDVPWEQTGDEK